MKHCWKNTDRWKWSMGRKHA